MEERTDLYLSQLLRKRPKTDLKQAVHVLHGRLSYIHQ